MIQTIIDVAFLVLYAVIVTAVLPFLLGGNENFGTLIPGALALTSGAVIWSALTWAGMSDTDGWIWGITMVAMPLVMGILMGLYGRGRAAGKFGFVDTYFGAKAKDEEFIGA